MSDVVVFNRLRASADWLGANAAALLVERYPEAVTDTGEQRLPTPAGCSRRHHRNAAW
jgi:hypothetical protein